MSFVRRSQPDTRARAALPSVRTAIAIALTGLVVFAASWLVCARGTATWDTRLFQEINDPASGVAAVLTPVSKLFLPAGIAVGVVLGAGYVWLRNRSAIPIAAAAASAGLAWILAHAAKAAVSRPRPYEVVPNAILRQDPAHGTSFPSAHTCVAVAVVVVLIPFLSRRAASAAVGYAVLVGWSRVYLGVHYPLDVVAGAGLGLVAGGLVLAALGAARRPSSRSSTRWIGVRGPTSR
jgi:membrane-associated phospholipid phosphatase